MKQLLYELIPSNDNCDNILIICILHHHMLPIDKVTEFL